MKTNRFRSALCISVALALTSSYAYATDLMLNDTPARILFSPGDMCTEAIMAEIKSAKTEILVQAYSLTSARIAEALVEAHKRGVKVEVILDKRRNKDRDSKGTILVDQEIQVFTDGEHPIANNKIMIIDRQTVITGSFNFTKDAERNAENLIVIGSEDLAKFYIDSWNAHKQHSEVLASRY